MNGVAFSHGVDSGNAFYDNEPNDEEKIQGRVPRAETKLVGEQAKSVTANFEPDEDDIYGSGDPVDEDGTVGSSFHGLSAPSTSLYSRADGPPSSSTGYGSQSSGRNVQNHGIPWLSNVRRGRVHSSTAHSRSSYSNPLATPVTHSADVANEEEQEEQGVVPAAVAKSPGSDIEDWCPYKNRDRDNDNDDCGW